MSLEVHYRQRPGNDYNIIRAEEAIAQDKHRECPDLYKFALHLHALN